MVITIGNCAKTATREKSGLGRLFLHGLKEKRVVKEKTSGQTHLLES